MQVQAVSLLVCDACRQRVWYVSGHPVGPKLAREIDQMLLQTDSRE